jgi:hypothetical protein
MPVALTAGGDVGCCVELAWVQAGAIDTHDFGPSYYNWSGCFDMYPTVKACNPP